MAARRATYMSAVGALLWLAAGTRPDLTYTVALLARFCSNPAERHYKALLRALLYLHGTVGRALRMIPDDACEVDVYSDASWATKNSVSGGLVRYLACPVVWWSRRQRSIAASTTEAEYFSAALASREGVFVRDLLDDLGFSVTRPTPLYIDSKSAIELASDPVAFKRTKHILRHAYELRDRVMRRVFTPEFVDTANQLADILTKGLRAAPHRVLLDRLLHCTVSSAPSHAPAMMVRCSRAHQHNHVASLLLVLALSAMSDAAFHTIGADIESMRADLCWCLNALATCFSVQRPRRPTRAAVCAALAYLYWPDRFMTPRAAYLVCGASASGFTKWCRILRRVPLPFGFDGSFLLDLNAALIAPVLPPLP